MKVIIDTNILISAILKNRIPEEVVFNIIINPAYQWLASSEIMDEYKKVLVRPKFKLSETVLQQWFSIFEKHITVVSAQLPIDFPRDPKDAKFLACAIATQADIFISGDKDFSEAQKLLEQTQILSVREFFNRFVAVLNPDLH